MKASRKKKIFLKKIFLVIFVICSYFINELIKYDFDHGLINSILLIVYSITFSHIIDNDKFYIDTGITMDELEETDIKNKEMFSIFNKEHKFIALYNMLISIAVIISFIFALIMAVMHFIN